MSSKNKLIYKKFLTLKNVLYSYEIYKGGFKSLLEKEIDKLKLKLSEEEYNNLQTAFNDYQEYIINIFANTRRVFVKLEDTKKLQQVNFDDLNNIFEDIN